MGSSRLTTAGRPSLTIARSHPHTSTRDRSRWLGADETRSLANSTSTRSAHSGCPAQLTSRVKWSQMNERTTPTLGSGRHQSQANGGHLSISRRALEVGLFVGSLIIMTLNRDACRAAKLHRENAYKTRSAGPSASVFAIHSLGLSFQKQTHLFSHRINLVLLLHNNDEIRSGPKEAACCQIGDLPLGRGAATFCLRDSARGSSSNLHSQLSQFPPARRQPTSSQHTQIPFDSIASRWRRKPKLNVCVCFLV